MKAYIDLSQKVGAEWIVVHGGYHFTACRKLRMQAAIERLQRMADYAGKKGALLLLENLNWEPVLAEVNYMPVTPGECRVFFDALQSPAIQWSFTANHAHFLPGVGIENSSTPWISAAAGKSASPTITVPTRFISSRARGRSISARYSGKPKGWAMPVIMGYAGHYMNGFGTVDDMLVGRDYMLARAAEAGVDTG